MERKRIITANDFDKAFRSIQHNYVFTDAEIHDEYIVSLQNPIIKTQISFTHSTFLKKISFSSFKDKSAVIHFSFVVFKEAITLSGFKGEIYFTECVFEDLFEFRSYESKLDITNCQSYTRTYINGDFSNIRIINCLFEQKLDHDAFELNCSVTDKFEIKDSKLFNINIYNSKIEGAFLLANNVLLHNNHDFRNGIDECNFIGRVSILDCRVDGDLSLTDVTFKSNFTFTGNQVNNKLSFLHSQFEMRAFFNVSNLESLYIYECQFSDLALFNNLNINQLKITNTNFNKNVDFTGTNVNKSSRENFRFIKNEFLKVNEQMESLHYRSKELEAYRKDLFKNKDYGEYFLLTLNNLSNEHGVSWFRGLIFTISIALFLYTIYLISLQTLPFDWGWKGWAAFWAASGAVIEYFVRFFIVTHDLDFMKAYGPTASSFVIDFVAKIFIGYGIYQTVSAFRKHGKS